MIEILKWYSIILIGLTMIISLCKMFYSDDGVIRLSNLIALLLYIPMLIYWIMSY